MLEIIARESRNVWTFAERAEAWAHSEAHPPTWKEIARTYIRVQGWKERRAMRVILEHLALAKTRREAATDRLFKTIITNINNDTEE